MAGDRTLMVDGSPVSEGDLTCLALANYGAYTSFRFEQGGVRGLDLHLARLEASALELFGEAVGEARLRELMRSAVEGQGNCWLRVSLFSPEVWPRTPGWTGRPKVMIGVFPPPPPLAEDGLRLQVQTYARELAHLKHTANFGLIRARRLARAAGFDDALFADSDGRISEGSLWNIGFVRGDAVIWPEAPMLTGVTLTLLQGGLEARGMSSRTRPVQLEDLPRFDGAFICNSATPACPVASIDALAFDPAAAPLEALRSIWASQPCQPI
ncbi:MAG: aminotransferase class IV [Alphaproteobacteria bacterium]|nr:aminotransferase class IV [Alphaproteobacteria bacterium]MBU2271571.1 aminotransferase class IV [Alphaproteobacteria bacterium]MBU2419331.1 aminotransferase class IV [Alphaproteobacteria bacterium]